MPAIEHLQSRDQQHQADRIAPINLQSVQHETWGMHPTQARSAQKGGQSNALEQFGNLTIDTASQGDSLRDWCAKPFQEFQPPAGLKAADEELAQSKGSIDDRLLAVEVGTVKGVYSVGNSVVGMANAIVSPPAEFGNWLANTIKNPNTAINDSANFGAHVGKTIADDVKAVRAADAYVQTVKEAQAHGNYSKPLVDIGNELHRVAEKFGKLNPAEQTKLVTEQVVSLELQVATGKVLTSAPKAFASLLEKMDEFKVKSDAHRLHFGVETNSSERLAQQATLDSRHHEDRFAGAKDSNSDYEEFNKVRRADIPIQFHKNACVAAVGEILTKGEKDQRALAAELDLYLIEPHRGQQRRFALEDLAKELGEDWAYRMSGDRTVNCPLLNKLIASEKPFGTSIKTPENGAHAVVVEGISKAGRLIILDPGDGTMSEVNKQDFVKVWTGLVVAPKNF